MKTRANILVFALFIFIFAVLTVYIKNKQGHFKTLVHQRWQPGVAHYGRVPWEFCILEITDDKLIFADTKNNPSTYKIVDDDEITAILEVNAKESDCFNPNAIGTSYWRFDRESFWGCQPDLKKRGSDCPEKFLGEVVFAVSIFKSLQAAREYSAEPTDMHPFFEY